MILYLEWKPDDQFIVINIFFIILRFFKMYSNDFTQPIMLAAINQ